MPESTYRFRHPVDKEVVTVSSQHEAEKLLLPWLLCEKQACEIVGEEVVRRTDRTKLLEHMLEGHHGHGARLCAKYHVASIGILCRTEIHFEDVDADSFDETEGED
jgi:hypothetical protein